MDTTADQRIRIEGTGLPLRGNDIDTDRIIPARFLKTVTFEGLGEHVFADDRVEQRETAHPHPFDDGRFKQARVLLVNKNFGCGSSREHAPQAISRRGLRAVVGESFAEIFFANCQAIGVPCLTVEADAMQQLQKTVEEQPGSPLVVDLTAREVRLGSGTVYPAGLPEGSRQAFLQGRWDSTTELLEAADQIRETATGLPYVNDFGGM